MAMDDWPRHGVRRFPLGAFYIEAYRRKDRLGDGVCFSLHHEDGFEVWRFDLFDPPHMHFHTGDGKKTTDAPRIFFPPGPFGQQVDRALWELRNNQLAAFGLCCRPALRKAKLRKEHLDRVLPELRRALLELHEGGGR